MSCHNGEMISGQQPPHRADCITDMRMVDVADQRSIAHACFHKPQSYYWKRPFENKLRQAATKIREQGERTVAMMLSAPRHAKLFTLSSLCDGLLWRCGAPSIVEGVMKKVSRVISRDFTERSPTGAHRAVQVCIVQYTTVLHSTVQRSTVVQRCTVRCNGTYCLFFRTADGSC